MSKELVNVDDWVNKLSKEDLPALSQSVERISSIVTDQSSYASELARAILHDPAMAAKVLKVANSSYYDPSGLKINTISRAVVVLGYEAVRNICITLGVVDHLLKGNPPQQRLVEQVAQSFHAAIQAQIIGKQRGEKHTEDLFIAALLFELGKQTFLCYGGRKALYFDQLMTEGKLTESEIEEKVLGFKLQDLTLGLAKEWQLGSNLEELIAESNNPDSRWFGVHLCYELAKTTTKAGWKAIETQEIIKKLANFSGKDFSQISKILQEGANSAAQKFNAFHGSKKISQLIPSVIVEKKPDDAAKTLVEDASDEINAIEADPILQINILRELTASMYQTPDINIIIQMIQEGLHRGVGLDRVVVAIQNPERTRVKAKFALELRRTDLTLNFNFDIFGPQNTLFQRVLKEQEILWIGGNTFPENNTLLTTYVAQKLDCSEFFIGPITIGASSIGLFYADCRNSKRALSPEAFNNFCYFLQQGNLYLDLANAKRKKI